MCVVSNVGDYYHDRWRDFLNPTVQTGTITYSPTVTKAEFDALKKEVEEMKRLLINAKEIDDKTGQKDCEQEEKVKILKEVAKLVGINLEDIWPQK